MIDGEVGLWVMVGCVGDGDGDGGVGLPAEPGTYVVLLWVERATVVTIGRLGCCALEGGCYCYVGSALGSGGLRGRVGHHLRVSVRPRWHVDYLRQVARPVGVWFVVGRQRWEHRWAGCLGGLAGCVPMVRGFGTSDCGCMTHLFAARQVPVLGDFQSALCGVFPEHPLVVSWLVVEGGGVVV